jgi:hypothetical protein
MRCPKLGACKLLGGSLAAQQRRSLQCGALFCVLQRQKLSARPPTRSRTEICLLVGRWTPKADVSRSPAPHVLFRIPSMTAPTLPFQGISEDLTQGYRRAIRASNVDATSNPTPFSRRRQIYILSPSPRFGLTGLSAFRGPSGQIARATTRSSPMSAIARGTSPAPQAVQIHRSSWRETGLNLSRGEGHHSTRRSRNRCV